MTYATERETSEGKVFTVTGGDWDTVVGRRVGHQLYDLRWSGAGIWAPLYSTGMPPSG